MSNSEGDRSYERFFGEKYPRVTREEIDRANRDLARGIDSFEASDLLSRAEKAGQYLRRDIYYPEGSVFAKTQLTTEMGFSDWRRNLNVERSTVTYRLSDDMQTIVSVETPRNPDLNIIVKPVARAKSLLGQVLLGVTPPPFSSK